MAMSGGADVLTPTAMVFLQDRPIVPLNRALANAIGECENTNRVLQVVTSPSSRITLPLRTSKAQWIVHSDGYYEGLTGRPMLWGGSSFTTDPGARDYAPAYTTRTSVPIGSQLVLTFQAPPSEHRGTRVETLMRLLTGHPPAGWGTTEPLEHSWNASDLPNQRVIAVGAGVIATVEVSGGTELTTLTAGYGPGKEPPLTELPSLIGELADTSPVASLVAQLNPGPADLTTEPRWTGAAAPIGLAVNGTFNGAPGFTRHRVGPLTWFPLGDGRSPEYWQRHRELLAHLRSR
ncbi:hypothetical protein GCM10022254_69970 [Actinomadura meridiana]|uniref:Uncharacterized protein n=1 Tax=Actinomadura meridiana TaxID=559626 RepID=A0ABP8CN20_9ACTN